MGTLVVLEEPATCHTGSGAASCSRTGKAAGCCPAAAALPARAAAAPPGTAGLWQRLQPAPRQQGLRWLPRHNAGPPPHTPLPALLRGTKHCKVSRGLMSEGSCESRKVLETWLLHIPHARKKERSRKKKNSVLPMPPTPRLRESDLRS